MKNKIYIIVIILVVIIIGIFILKNKSPKDNNINLKCNNNYVSLTKNDKKVLGNYLSKEKLSKNIETVKCKAYGTYTIEYNDSKIIFDETVCVIELYNEKTLENYQTTLSNDLINYVKNICH